MLAAHIPRRAQNGQRPRQFKGAQLRPARLDSARAHGLNRLRSNSAGGRLSRVAAHKGARETLAKPRTVGAERLPWGPLLITPLLVGVVLGLGGAFDTGRMRLAVRLAYWVVLMLFGSVVGRSLAIWVITRPRFLARRWASAAVIAAVTSLVMTLVVWLANSVVGNEPLRIVRLGYMFLPVLIISAATTVLSVLVDGQPTTTSAAPADAPAAKFLDRMPPRLAGGALFAVEAQDHYLRLHTSLGEDLILMRLTDAIAELEGIEGARTHRSWWVARDAIVGVERAEGRASLTLPNGAHVPVSRSYARTLREAGWF